MIAGKEKGSETTTSTFHVRPLALIPKRRVARPGGAAAAQRRLANVSHEITRGSFLFSSRKIIHCKNSRPAVHLGTAVDLMGWENGGGW